MNDLRWACRLPHLCVTEAKNNLKPHGQNKMQDQLILRLKQQDQTAIAELYDAYGSALYGVVLKVVQTHETAQQVLQDTFLKAWRNAATYDETKGRLFTWLLNIARNTAIDATRTAHFQHRRQTEPLDQLTYQPGGQNVNPEHIGLRQLVEGLEDKYRTLVDLVYFNGYTQEEVATHMGIPLGTVKTRLRSALNELRNIFA